jgi:chaperonin GroEL
VGKDNSTVVGKIVDKEQYNFGYDVQSDEYGNLMRKGIIDATKVCAQLQGVASVAGPLITTEAMVAEVPGKQSPAMPGGSMDF